MELSNLVGRHTFSGIELGSIMQKGFFDEDQECQFVKFTLDGVHYMAIEDPDDGYRSRCRELQVSDTPPKFSFPPQSVVCRMKEDRDGYGNDDILVVIDRVTNEMVLEVGTGDYDDWYPYCHFEYRPEHMAINNIEISDASINSILGY